MTEARAPARKVDAKKVRWSREHVRALAWVAGSATFFTGVAVLGAAPRVAATGANTSGTSGNVAVQRVTRKVFVIDKPKYITPSSGGAPVYSGGSSTGGSTAGGGTTTGGGPAPAPAPPPACSTGPSPTC